jgi:hypothetical protein
MLFYTSNIDLASNVMSNGLPLMAFMGTICPVIQYDWHCHGTDKRKVLRNQLMDAM